jgi:hypothetical protein
MNIVASWPCPIALVPGRQTQADRKLYARAVREPEIHVDARKVRVAATLSRE